MIYKCKTNPNYMDRDVGSPYLKFVWYLTCISIDLFTMGNSDALRKKSSGMLVLQFRMGLV